MKNKNELKNNDNQLSNINVSTTQSQVKMKDLVRYFSVDDFSNFNYIYNELSNVIKFNNRYTIITRVCYVDQSIGISADWKTLGEQICLVYNTYDGLYNDLKSYQDTIINRLEYTLELYNIPYSNVMGIQLIVYKVNYTNIVIEKNKFTVNSLGVYKDLVNVSKISESLNKALPLTFDKNSFGILLNKSLFNGFVDYITLLDGTKVNFCNRINKYISNNKKLNNLPEDMDFYQKSYNKNNVIITVFTFKDNNVYKNDINIYNINGMKIHHIIDEKLNSDSFTRTTGNVVAYVNNTGIYKKEIKLKFDPVYPNRITGPQTNMIYPDWKVGTMDIETYKENSNLSKAYAIGFYVNNDMNTFYIDEDLNSDNLIIKCLDSMLVDKYNGYTFYVHNLGRFDVFFILKVIINANELYPNKYDYKLNLRDDTILGMNISIKKIIKNKEDKGITTKMKYKTYTIRLVDSYNILQYKLDDLCKTFDTEVKKSNFPYEFVKKNNLFYIGYKPDIKYYKNINNITYKEIQNDNWSVKDQTITYLEKDLISLYNVIDKFKYNIYLNYHTHITKSLTISGIAMNIFLRRFYNYNIPLINKKSIYNDIKNSYYGGITEVYKPYGKKLFYYDVNSLYPYSALNDMPGLNCVYVDNINKDISLCLNNLFGFYYCKIITSDNYIGLLPVRKNEGIIMPLGVIEGWYFSEELKFAYKHGYKIQIINGYNFDKSENVFKKYIDEFYNIKSNTTDKIQKTIAKSLLNNLLGRFGMNIDKYVTELVSSKEYLEILQSKPVRSVKFIGDKILVTYGSTVSADICEQHNVDFFKTFSNDLNNNIRKYRFKEDRLHDVSVAIASAVTSYSRIFMNKIKLDILNKGGSIYYTDTDSIVTDIKLNDNIVGKEIGKFKLEYEIKEAYFISNKTYCLILKDGTVVIKAKGVNSDDTLKVEDFRKLYLGENIDTFRNETIRNYSEGSVTIHVPRKISLSGKAYNKRIKIYNDEKHWIDTKPIYQT